MMLKIEPGLQAGNAAIQDGTLPKIVQDTMAALKPECSYFYADNGGRAAMMVFEMSDASDIPAAVEPLIQQLDCKVELIPVMNADELAAGLEKASR